MHWQSYESEASFAGAKLRERWLRLLFDMYGIQQITPRRIDPSALPDSALVRMAGTRRRVAPRGGRAVVLPFRTERRSSTSARKRRDHEEGIDQADGDPSESIPTSEPTRPVTEPRDDTTEDAGEIAPRPENAPISPAADGDDRPAEAGELH